MSIHSTDSTSTFVRLDVKVDRTCQSEVDMARTFNGGIKCLAWVYFSQMSGWNCIKMKRMQLCVAK